MEWVEKMFKMQKVLSIEYGFRYSNTTQLMQNPTYLQHFQMILYEDPISYSDCLPKLDM